VSDELGPERSVRLLRAKAAELEQQVLRDNEPGEMVTRMTWLTADVALLYSILAEFIEGTYASLTLYEAHTENLIERVHTLEQAAHYHTKTGKVLTYEDIQALADEAERGYDVSQLKPREPRD
jgi:hypothetical protein